MTARPRRRWAPRRAPAALAVLAVLAAGSACGGDGDAGDPGPEAAVEVPPGSTGVAEAPGGGPTDAPGDSPPPAAVGEPAPADSLPPLPGEEPPAEPVTYRLLLVNSGADGAVVHASAGASRVVLDTVQARDSVRVDVRLRSDRILLEAVAPGGAPLGAVEILLEADSLNRWELPSVARGVETDAAAVPRRL